MFNKGNYWKLYIMMLHITFRSVQSFISSSLFNDALSTTRGRSYSN